MRRKKLGMYLGIGSLGMVFMFIPKCSFPTRVHEDADQEIIIEAFQNIDAPITSWEEDEFFDHNEEDINNNDVN
jgi:hypothetical protein